MGQSGVKQTTPGSDGQLGYNYIAKDDDVWVYSGVTSATADNSIIGFVLINQRTAESKFYPVAGATEESAMSSAEEMCIRDRLKKVGELSVEQLREIAEIKMPDLNANDIEAAMEIVAGTARSMGVTIEGRAPKKEYKVTRRLQALLQGESAE